MNTAICVTTLVFIINSAWGLASQKPCNLPSNTCLFDPCWVAKCTAYPNAQCRDYKCGNTCQKEFWLGTQEVTSMCDAAGGQTDPAEDLLSILFSPSGAGIGNSGTFPNAVQNTGTQNTGTQNTGTQNTGTQITGSQPTSLIKPLSSRCAGGEKEVSCFRRPCAYSTCPGVPSATCLDNYCGTCHAHFYVGRQDVTAYCQRRPPQPTPKPLPQPEAQATPKPLPQPEAQATPKPLDPRPQPNINTGTTSIGGCPANMVTKCNFSPCRVSSCNYYPQAQCRESFCGGCIAKFYYRGQEVTSSCRRQRQRPQRRYSMPPWYYMMFGDGMF